MAGSISGRRTVRSSEHECRQGQASGDDERERRPRSPAVRTGVDEACGEGGKAGRSRGPGRADRAVGAGVASRPRAAREASAAASPTGTLARKIARQPTDATRMPPTTGPLARPTPDMAPQTASARRRACGSVKVWAIRASEQGINQAAPMPCATRAAIRNATEFAPAHAALARTNTASPTRKPLRTPILSASEPARRSSDANATMYPSTTHCAIEGAPPRSAPIAPRATFTIVASSVIIRKPAEIAANASPRPFGSPRPRDLGRQRLASTSMPTGCRPPTRSATTGWLTLLGAG